MFKKQTDTNLLHTCVGCVAIISYVLFGLAFIGESVAFRYLPSYYFPGMMMYSRAATMISAAVGLLIFVLISSNKILPKFALFLIFWLALTSFSAIVGAVLENPNHAYLSHIQYYLSFFVILVICAFAINLNATKLLAALRVISIITIPVLVAILIVIYATTTPGYQLSLTLNLAIFPLAYFLSLPIRIRNIFSAVGKLLITSVIFLTMKRGLWVVWIVGMLLGSSLRLNKKELIRSSLIAGLLFVIAVLAILVEGESAQEMVSDIEVRLSSRFQFNEMRGSSAIDAVSSGRIGNMFSILTELADSNLLVTGFGFGATIDLNRESASLQEWVTSGADVLLLHFWMLHGILIGTILVLALTWFIFNGYCWHVALQDQWFSFWFYALALNYVGAWFTFVPWDPVWPISIGLLTARLIQLRRYQKADDQVSLTAVYC